jgi:hypothetical protein
MLPIYASQKNPLPQIHLDLDRKLTGSDANGKEFQQNSDKGSGRTIGFSNAR